MTDAKPHPYSWPELEATLCYHGGGYDAGQDCDTWEEETDTVRAMLSLAAVLRALPADLAREMAECTSVQEVACWRANRQNRSKEGPDLLSALKLEFLLARR